LRAEATDLMKAEGVRLEASETTLQLELRYRGQSSEIAVDLAQPPSREGIDAAVQDFHREHERTYGYFSPQEPVQLVNLRLRVRARAGRTAQVRASGVRPAIEAVREARSETRRVYFGERWGWQDTPVLRRAQLGAATGPLVIEEYDTTTVVPPGACVDLDDTGCIRIDLSEIL